jgi:hypothetical protein
MKLKLIIISTIAILTLVGYQKYSDYSFLKSINSYDSCVSAKGSVIKESYPATCITLLGSSFTETIKSPSSQDLPQITQKDINQGWYWGDENQKKLNTPSDWIFSSRGKSSCWHEPNQDCMSCRPRPNCNADNTYCDTSIAVKLDGSINWCPLP